MIDYSSFAICKINYSTIDICKINLKMMRRTQTLTLRSLIKNIHACSSAAAAAAGEHVNHRGEPYSTATAIAQSLKWPPSSSHSTSWRLASLGVAGALSFTLAVATAAEAKAPPSPDLMPKDVVLYQYEACPFCNKVKGNTCCLSYYFFRLFGLLYYFFFLWEGFIVLLFHRYVSKMENIYIYNISP